MVYCDKNENVLEWSSEEIALPYKSPLDNRIHRYFPDFYIRSKKEIKYKNIWSRLNPKDKFQNQKFRKEKQRVISMK